MRRNKNSARRAKGKRGRGLQAQNASCTEVIIGWSSQITQGTTGGGALSNFEGGSSYTNVTNIILDPFILGGRFSTMASLFSQYKVHYGVFEYKPSSNYGYANNPAGGISTSTVAIQSRNFAMAIVDDVSNAPTSATGAIQSGGIVVRTGQSRQMAIPRSCCNKWLWTSTTTVSASATLVDERTACFGLLCCRWLDSSTTANATYGNIFFRLKVSFKGPVQVAAPIGALRAPRVISVDDEEKKISSSERDETTSTHSVGGNQSLSEWVSPFVANPGNDQVPKGLLFS